MNAKHKATQRLTNYLRMHRRKSGLSQRELERVLGYRRGAVSQHEVVKAIPPLRVAIAYEIIYRTPVVELFAGLRDTIADQIEARLALMEETLGQRSGRDRYANATAKKLMWLSERRSPDTELA